MKKIGTVLVALTLCAGVLCGCAGNGGKVQISIGGWPAKEGKELDDKVAQKAEFEKIYETVEIVPDTWSFDLSTFYPKAMSGKLPTVYNTHYTEAEKIISGGYSADLTDKLKEDGMENVFNEDIYKLISSDGRIYAYPITVHALGLAYNVDLFEKAGLMNSDGTPKEPKNWEEVAQFAQIIKEKTGVAGFMFPSANKNGGWLFNVLAWSFGAEFMKQDGEGKWIATLNTDACAQALQYIKDMKWKYGVMPSNTLIDDAEFFKLFSTGQAGMVIAADDIAAKTVKYEMDVNHLGMLPMPAGPKKRVTMLTGSIFCISNKAKEAEIDAGVNWIKFLGFTPVLDETAKKNRETTYQEYANEGRLIGIKTMSPWNDSAEFMKNENQLMEKYINGDPNHFKAFNESIANLEKAGIETKLEEPVCTQDLYSVLDNCIQEVLNNENADVKKLLEDANTDFQVNYLDNITY